MAKKANDDMKEVKYKCTQCGADDTGRFFPSEAILPIINCWKCHAGFRMDPAQQLAAQSGMIPVR